MQGSLMGGYSIFVMAVSLITCTALLFTLMMIMFKQAFKEGHRNQDRYIEMSDIKK